MRHVITGILEGSIAAKNGLQAGDVLLSVNGETVQDEIDYQAFTAKATIKLLIEREGTEETILIQKEDWEPLGLRFGDSMVLKPRTCRNKCIFCFIDQNPPDLRSSLYVKDDDWRYSLMMGNYITLTNVNEQEFDRIIKRHASPLYISVHTTDPALRVCMMNNRNAGDILPRLRRLKDAGIRFHSQIVCCPGFNDGDILTQALNDLADLAPAALSVAIVPVGLTKFRDGLTNITPFDSRSAMALLRQIEPFQAHCKDNFGTSFAFASDEFYCLSGAALPSAEWYEGYPQIENGVGLLRQFEEQMREASEDAAAPDPAEPKSFIIVSGTAAAPYLREFCDLYAPKSTDVHIETILNHFFGETVTVTGLLTGKDILDQLSPSLLREADELLLSANTLNHDRELFLCGMTFQEFKRRLPLPVQIVDDGYDLYNVLHNR